MWTGDGLPESDKKILADCKELMVWRAVVGGTLAGGLIGGLGQSHSTQQLAHLPRTPAARNRCTLISPRAVVSVLSLFTVLPPLPLSVYGRGLLTPRRRYIITLATALWGTGVGAMSASPVCIKRASRNKDPDSVLRRELARIAVQHNPNRAMEQVAREKLVKVHRLREQEAKQRLEQQSSAEGGELPGRSRSH